MNLKVQPIAWKAKSKNCRETWPMCFTWKK